MGEVFNYLFDEQNSFESLRRIFQRVHRALASGGVFIFDVAEPERGRSGRNFWEGDGWICLVENRHDVENKRLSRRCVTFRRVDELYRRQEETHQLQLYSESDIARLLNEIGFEANSARRYGDYPLPPGIVGFVAKKT